MLTNWLSEFFFFFRLKEDLSAVVQVDVQIMKVDFASGNSPKVEMNQTANRRRLTVKEMALTMVKVLFCAVIILLNVETNLLSFSFFAI